MKQNIVGVSSLEPTWFHINDIFICDFMIIFLCVFFLGGGG